ncbi:MAG TPA: glycine betaine ABC transporter substrate-binding protein, partial [Solirubrobacteraceae bacterium]|nr:glycine betaine ABC transporter substrate-binding protein [Solirubrobacteraceae bacterium]
PTTSYEQPPVRIDQAHTTPANELPGFGKPPVLLGDMNTPEQFLLGALYSVALSQNGYSVEITHNIGTTEISQDALKQGSLDIYPEYLNVWNAQVAHVKARFATGEAAYVAGSAYAVAHGFQLLTPTPFSDTSGLVVTSQFARQNDIHSLTQLRKLPLLTYGIPPGFDLGPEGLRAAQRTYRFKPGYLQTIYELGDQYSWLNAGNVQVAYAGTTDPQLVGDQYTLLDDPEHVFGFGNIVPVTTPASVRKEGPAFVDIIDRVDALLTTSAMRGLNDEVEIEGHNPIGVAEQFLQGNGLLPPSRYSVTG